MKIKNLLSNRVSNLTTAKPPPPISSPTSGLTASSNCNGSLGSEAETTNNFLIRISTSLWEQLETGEGVFEICP